MQRKDHLHYNRIKLIGTQNSYPLDEWLSVLIDNIHIMELNPPLRRQCRLLLNMCKGRTRILYTLWAIGAWKIFP